MVVWLNYSFPVVLWRAYRRTLIRSARRQAIHWLTGWQERDDAEFRELTQAAVAADRWVVDSSYNVLRDIV